MVFCFAGGILQWIMAIIDRIWLHPDEPIIFIVEISTGWILVGMGFIIQELRKRNRS